MRDRPYILCFVAIVLLLYSLIDLSAATIRTDRAEAALASLMDECESVRRENELLTARLHKELTDSEIGLVPSSTKIRKALLSGTVEEANLMLGYAYTLSGEVVEGRHLGRTIGFPTANIHVPSDKLCPLSGVYAALLTDEELGFNNTPVIVNIGTNPTVGGRQTTVEAHIPDWEGDLYGRHLSVRLTRYLRAEKKFPSMDVLKQQIHKDIENLKSHN